MSLTNSESMKKKKEKEKEKEREREIVCQRRIERMCVCVNVCVRERERERELPFRTSVVEQVRYYFVMTRVPPLKVENKKNEDSKMKTKLGKLGYFIELKSTPTRQ